MSIKTVEPKKLLEKMRTFLHVYRLTVEPGDIETYCRVLGGLTERELEVAIERAIAENQTGFAPSPGVIKNIALEIRGGGQVLKEINSWGEPEAHPDWLDDEEWLALKSKVGVKLKPEALERFRARMGK